MEFKLLMELKEREPLINGDGTAIAPVIIKEIQSNIRKGAKDLDQNWKSAVHLCRKAFDVTGYEIPAMAEGDAWAQYEHLISVAVRELHKARGSSGQTSKWRSTELKDRSNGKTLPQHVQPLNTLPADEKYLKKHQ